MTCNHKWSERAYRIQMKDHVEYCFKCKLCGKNSKDTQGPHVVIHLEDLAPNGRPDEYQWGECYDGMPVVTER